MRPDLRLDLRSHMRPGWHVAVLLLVAGCPPDEPGSEGEGEGACPQLVLVPGGELRLAVGATDDVQAVDPEGGEAVQGLAWTAGDPAILMVLGDGGVVAKQAGGTTLTVQSECGSKAGIPVRVLDRIAIEPATVALESGQTVTLIAKGTDGTVVTAESSWSGQDGTVARVDEAGTVTAIGPGTTTIRAEWQGLTDQVEIEVTEVEAPTGHIAWTVGAWAPTQGDYETATAESPGVVTLGNCGQAGSNHIWLSGEVPASSEAPDAQRFGWATVRVKVLAPEPGEVRDFRSFVIFDPAAPRTLFAPEIEWRTPDYNPEAWTGRTIELQVFPDDEELLPSAPAVFELVDRTTPDNLCCDPGDC